MSAENPTSRREFLQGRAAANALGSAIDKLSGVLNTASEATKPSDSAAQQERYLVQLSRPAMACQFAVFLNAGQYEEGTEAALAALDLVELLEAQLTVYRDTSEVMMINQRAAQVTVPVETGLYTLLALAARLSQATGGAFDITAGPLVKVWGFYKRAGAIPPADELQAALACVGSQHLVFDDAALTIRFNHPGLELNLGAIGKGYALDRAAELLAAAGVHDVLLHGGQSSVLARGSHAGSDSGGWLVGLANPLRPEQRLAEIVVHDRALATSGASHQFFRSQGKRFGHILDPRTGWPAEGVFSSTVVAPTAAAADALSTAFYTLGVDGALAYCREHPEVGMVLLHPGKGASSVELTSAGLGERELRRIS